METHARQPAPPCPSCRIPGGPGPGDSGPSVSQSFFLPTQVPASQTPPHRHGRVTQALPAVSKRLGATHRTGHRAPQSSSREGPPGSPPPRQAPREAETTGRRRGPSLCPAQSWAQQPSHSRPHSHAWPCFVSLEGEAHTGTDGEDTGRRGQDSDRTAGADDRGRKGGTEGAARGRVVPVGDPPAFKRPCPLLPDIRIHPCLAQTYCVRPTTPPCQDPAPCGVAGAAGVESIRQLGIIVGAGDAEPGARAGGAGHGPGDGGGVGGHRAGSAPVCCHSPGSPAA